MTRAAMCNSLPSPLREWVAERAKVMGLPGPDNYILLLLRLEKQRMELEAAVSYHQHEESVE